MNGGDLIVSDTLHLNSKAQACTLKTLSSNSLRFFQLFSDSIVSILLDSGATHSFLAKHIHSKYSLPIIHLARKLPLFILSTQSEASQWISYETTWDVKLPSFPTFKWDFLVIDSPDTEDIILGYDFLLAFNPEIDWIKGTIHPRKAPGLPSDATQLTPELDPHSEPILSSSSSFLPDACTSSVLTSFIPNSVLNPQHINFPIFSLFKAEVFEDQHEEHENSTFDSLPLELRILNLSSTNSISNGTSYSWQDFEDEEDEEEIETVKTVVPQQYHDFLDIFSKSKADKLPIHRDCDHHIELVGPVPPVGPIYSLTKEESLTLQSYIAENVEKGFIRPSSSSTGSPVLFVKKKDGSLRLCVDYRKLNNVTRKNRYPIPPMSQLLTVFQGAKVFSKLDLRGAYNLLRIREGDEHLTAFRTKWGSYEYLVMPFGLTNAPASFQNLVNDIFADLLESYVVVYLDDILVYSKTLEEHITHVKEVLTRLRKNCLYAKASKCIFHSDSVNYLGYVVNPQGLFMDQDKISRILDWPEPTSIKSLQSFLGFANFYRKFIHNYSKKIINLTSLLKKSNKSNFILNDQARQEFESLKKAFTSAPVLRHFDPSLFTIVETDASDYALGAVLSQLFTPDSKHPIAFDSRKMTSHEVNYEIHDKELLGIVWALQRWRSYLLSLDQPFEVFTDHSSLKYFMTSKVLTRRQARWAEALSEFHFTITYRPGKWAVLPDTLSRRDDVYPEGGTDFIDNNPANFRQLIKQDDIKASKCFSISVQRLSKQSEELLKAQKQDSSLKKIFNDIHQGIQVQDYSIDEDSRLLLWKEKIVIPDQDQLKIDILQQRHDSPLAGHPGQEKTIKLVGRDYYWPNMAKFIRDYVNSCFQCCKNKNRHHKKYGQLQPLPIPDGPWTSLSMDFISQLPVSNGFDSILVIVDRFSKMSIFVRSHTTATSLDLATIFIDRVFSKHGLPEDIVSDRGSLFVSSFWESLCTLLKIKRNLSTAFHPETDGQTERVNQVLEQYLRMYVNYHQDDWDTWLPMAEFAYNNAEHSSSKQSPFFTIYGRHPRFDTIQVKDSRPADQLVSIIKQTQDQLKVELNQAVKRFKSYADNKRIKPPEFTVGDSVWLSSKHIKSTRPTKKLSERWLGPFKIIEKIGLSSFKLQLPSQWKSVHPVFHVSLLEPLQDSAIKGRHQPPPSPVEVEDHEEFEVSQILDSKFRYGKLHYLVEWKGYYDSGNQTTWEPASNLANSQELVRDFHKLYPNKPGSNS